MASCYWSILFRLVVNYNFDRYKVARYDFGGV